MADVRLHALSKHFASLQVVKEIDLHIRDKEFVVLVGPSGCGKSTTLRMIAGLESISSGELYIGNTLVNALPAKDRDIAMVFQNYALYPHMSVYDNMAFGLKIKGVSKSEIQTRVEKAAAIVGLTEYLKRRPGTLSGGQRQRVALGRAIVRNPSVFLFDEPLSNLDAKMRVQMRMEISRLQRQLGVTTIYVTHDQTEAMTMADRIAVMKDGVLQQFDTPLHTYAHPANLFVASFIGSPSMNLISGRTDAQGNFMVPGTDLQFNLGDFLFSAHRNREVVLGIRPEDIHGDNGLNIPAWSPIRVEVEAVEPLGSDSYIYGTWSGHPVTARVRPDHTSQPTDNISLFVNRSKIHLFDPVSGLRLENESSRLKAV